MISKIRWFLPLFAAAALGCGSKQEEVKQGVVNQPSAAPPAVQPAAPVAAKPVNAAPASPVGGAAKPATPTPAAGGEEAPELEPGFELVTMTPDDRAYELLPPSNDDPPKDLFAVATPQRGVDSTVFVTSPAGNGSAGPRTNAVANATLPEGLKAVPNSGVSSDGYPLRVTCEKDGAEMAYIPPGVVPLGLANGPAEASPVLVVPLDGYYIDVTEVTLKQYETYRKEMKESKKQFKPEPLNPNDPDDYAVRGIAWSEARLYAQWAGKTLPTEAQWEMAARGPSGFLHPWGNDSAIWPRIRTLQELTPVKSFRNDRSIFGVYDLAGNVREWTSDLYSATAYKDAQNSPTSGLKNWEGPKKGSIDNTRVVKGNGPDWAVWHRAPGKVGDKIPDVGFRCVVSLKTSAGTKKAN